MARRLPAGRVTAGMALRSTATSHKLPQHAYLLSGVRSLLVIVRSPRGHPRNWERGHRDKRRKDAIERGSTAACARCTPTVPLGFGHKGRMRALPRARNLILLLSLQ